MVDTELVTGFQIPSFVKATPPEGVAEAIVKAVRSNRYQTYIPRSMGGASWLTSLLPRRLVEAAGRAVGAEKALLEHDEAARSAYEERVRQETG